MSLSEDKSFENLATEVEDSTLKSCRTCGRTFNPQSLERHEKICEKTKKCNHRTVFNSFLQRAKEIAAVPVKAETKDKESSRNKKKRREEHESLMRVVRLGKNFPGDLLNNGLSPQKSIPPGYQQCPSCERYFSEKAADRHILWCQEQRSRLPKTPTNTEALARLNARVKYRAPMPKKKNLNELNERLVKSAESIRDSSAFRTHSSPPDLSADTKPPHKRASTKAPHPHQHKSLEKNAPIRASNNISQYSSSNENNQVSKTKKAVKFKELFPVCESERNRNLDMLAALQLHLSELRASDLLENNSVARSKSSTSSPKHHSETNCFRLNESWSPDGELLRSASSGLPLNHLEHPLPRFCYNCGTKYPIVSAKYCCECGAQRFIFGLNDTRLSVP